MDRIESSDLESVGSSSDSFSSKKSQAEGPRKRKNKPDCIKQYVSNWHMSMVEKLFRVKWINIVKGSDVMRKAGVPLDLTERHRRYIEHLENILDFSENIDGFRLYSERLKRQFKNMKKQVNRSDDFKTYQRSLLFLIELLDDLREGVSREDPVYECTCRPTELVSRFAEVCLLLPYNHPSKSNWQNFFGKSGFRVSATPDLRFYKYGFDQKKSKISLCVKEVKRESHDIQIDRKQPKLDYQYSSSEGHCDIGVSREDRLKGQHVGELLLDLHHIIEDRCNDSFSEYSMPGLIIDGTKVSLTMLVISKEHYDKLKDGRPLGEKDGAFVYCSTFYDILLKSQRNDLIELFLCFDNLQV